MKCAVVRSLFLDCPLFAVAADHGPVFGLATPTNSQGEWSFDEGVFGRSTSVGSQASVRESNRVWLHAALDPVLHAPGRHRKTTAPAYPNSAGRRF